MNHNMIGIQEIASYIPNNRRSNYEMKDMFGIDDHFIEEKIGVQRVAQKDPGEDTSDLCVKAFEALAKKLPISQQDIDVLLVVTQNPDKLIPHTGAIVHGKLDLSENCACFDVSQGCPGYVYGLSILQSFMAANDLRSGLLFTADPYSKIVDPTDRNTSLLFGDAATVTLLSHRPLYVTRRFVFSTVGKDCDQLSCIDGRLYMNGRGVFNFTARHVPEDVKRVLEKNKVAFEDVDRFIFHQGSKYIVDTITRRLRLDKRKVVFDVRDYGNTVSSSIPILLESTMNNSAVRRIVISGFGVGLSAASTLLERVR